MRSSFLFILLSGCFTEQLTEVEKAYFESTWWEMSCSYDGCPFCFGLSTERNKIYTWYPDPPGLYRDGWWGYRDPNIYIWDNSNEVYEIVVIEVGECFNLHMGIFKETVCKCTLLPDNFIDPLE